MNHADKNYRREAARALLLKIYDLINQNADWSDYEVVTALLMNVCGVLGSITCSECRQQILQSVIEEIMPTIVALAMEAADEAPMSSARH